MPTPTCLTITAEELPVLLGWRPSGYRSAHEQSFSPEGS
jgi:hypothetical protein